MINVVYAKKKVPAENYVSNYDSALEKGMKPSFLLQLGENNRID